jgi:hypothetical protein
MDYMAINKGFYGFLFDYKYYIMESTLKDSSPQYLGIELINEIQRAIKNNYVKKWKEQIKKLKVFNHPDQSPSRYDINNVIKKTSFNKSLNFKNYNYFPTWKELLLEVCNNSPSKMLKSGYVLNITGSKCFKSIANLMKKYKNVKKHIYIINLDCNDSDNNENDNYLGSLLYHHNKDIGEEMCDFDKLGELKKRWTHII